MTNGEKTKELLVFMRGQPMKYVCQSAVAKRYKSTTHIALFLTIHRFWIIKVHDLGGFSPLRNTLRVIK